VLPYVIEKLSVADFGKVSRAVLPFLLASPETGSG
jgi:hypothetical protein